MKRIILVLLVAGALSACKSEHSANPCDKPGLENVPITDWANNPDMQRCLDAGNNAINGDK